MTSKTFTVIAKLIRLKNKASSKSVRRGLVLTKLVEYDKVMTEINYQLKLHNHEQEGHICTTSCIDSIIAEACKKKVHKET